MECRKNNAVNEFMSATTEQMKRVDQVFVDALSLPMQTKARLIEYLTASLTENEGSPKIKKAWEKEIQARCKAFDEGKLTERDADAFFRDLHQKVK